MVNVDIGLGKILEGFPYALEVGAIYGDEGIESLLRLTDDQFAPLEIFERRDAVHEHHLHSFARVLQRQTQTEKRTDCVTVRADVRRDQHML
ncbi:MAG: hypothetical protein AKCLJLPJ_01815 [Fimbriimonadales bacterium]|nr:hypothetical protein [Fimbriimonadales bacterium]